MHHSNQVITLEEFIIQTEKDFPYATGELSALLRDIGLAAKIIHRDVNKAGLVDILGDADAVNVQGEDQQKLDVFANDILINCLQTSGECAGIGSEEMDSIVAFESQESKEAKYIVMFDPLDGSSNIDVNVSIGTIFSIYRRQSTGHKCTEADFLQSGTNQIASGYVVYGSSTMMVYTTGQGVNGFTLDPSIGEFCLSHPNIRTKENGKIYSLNQGYYQHFSEGLKKYILHIQEVDPDSNRPYSLRYIGSMVADFHRNLIKGGVFIYPASYKSPQGKLRLQYECNPLSFIIEQAGGKSTNGNGERILDITPESLHQRTPIIIGTKQMVEQVESFIHKHDSVQA